MFTCQVLYTRAEEQEEEEVQIYFPSTKTMVNIKKEILPYIVCCATRLTR